MDNDTKIALDSVNKRIDRNEEDIKELRRTHEENIKELRSNDERNKELTTSLEKTVAVFAEKVDNYISSDRKKSEKTDKLIEQYGERIKVLEETPLKNKVKFFLFEIKLALADLPYYPLAARHKAVGLKIPAAHNMPFALFNELLNFFKQRGGVFFGVFINGHFVVTENIIEILREIRRALECG